jgi:hypothetical protein
MTGDKWLMKIIKELPADRIAQVENFVEFIAAHEHARSLTRAFAAASAPAFAAVWSNADNDVYDTLRVRRCG